MRCAITGATGLLGGNLAIGLLEQGHEIVAARRSTSDTSHLAQLDIDWFEAPLSDTDALARIFDGADVVFHCAAAVSIQFAVKPWIYAAHEQLRRRARRGPRDDQRRGSWPHGREIHPRWPQHEV